jgi:putative hydrolase of the HAD superfamily
LGGLLKFIVTSLDTHSEKPDSKIFLFSMEKANVKADESIFIGDQIESDIMGAKNAGMFPILIDRYGYYEDFSDALKIKNLDDLKKIF